MLPLSQLLWEVLINRQVKNTASGYGNSRTKTRRCPRNIMDNVPDFYGINRRHLEIVRSSRTEGVGDSRSDREIIGLKIRLPQVQTLPVACRRVAQPVAQHSDTVEVESASLFTPISTYRIMVVPWVASSKIRVRSPVGASRPTRVICWRVVCGHNKLNSNL